MNYELDSSQGFLRDSVEALVKRSQDDPRRIAIQKIAESAFESGESRKDSRGSLIVTPERTKTPEERANELRAYFHKTNPEIFDLQLPELTLIIQGFTQGDEEPTVREALRIFTNIKRSKDEDRYDPVFRKKSEGVNRSIVLAMSKIADKAGFSSEENISLRMLGLSARTFNCLNRYELRSCLRLSDSSEYGLPIDPNPNRLGTISAFTPEELLSIRNFGQKSLSEVQSALSAHGLSLATSRPLVFKP